jgi:hypothetical protein
MGIVDERFQQLFTDLSVERERARVIVNEHALKGGGGGGTYGGMSNDTNSDALKPRVDFLQTAFLWLAGIMVAAIGTIVLVAVNLTGATNTRLDRSVEATSALNREVGQLGVKADETNVRLQRIEDKLDRLSVGPKR